MKKQTKVMATLSTAALLALGFSAVSMAAGWDNSTGAWRYLNNDGTEVVDEWKSANGNWFYLDSDGVMATDKLIEDQSTSGKTKYYYVDQYGAMVKNTWKAVAMDDDDNTDLDAEYWWYYFGSDGKAYTTDNGKELTKSKVKTINGLKYAFDDEGHMFYGWIDKTNPQQADNNNTAWADADYYFNGWNDGHAQTGWAQINVEKADGDTSDYWFYFDDDGVKQAGKRKKINGVYYVFAEDGHMIDEWTIKDENATSNQWSTNFKATNATASKISYVNGDGAQRKNTWIWAIPDEDWLEGDYNDDEYSWFYAGKDGFLTVSQYKKINGKYYVFDQNGRMQTNFVKIDNKKFVDQTDAGDWTRDEWIAGVTDDGKHDRTVSGDEVLRYFSDNEEKDGSMKTGYQNIEMDDDTYQFYFTKNGDAKTEYNSTIKKYTIAGMILKPSNDDDNNYAAVLVDGDDPVDLITNSKYMAENYGKKTLILVNKSGTVVKGKTVRDENDEYWLTDKSGKIVNHAADKDEYDSLRSTKDANGNKKADEWNK